MRLSSHEIQKKRRGSDRKKKTCYISHKWTRVFPVPGDSSMSFYIEFTGRLFEIFIVIEWMSIPVKFIKLWPVKLLPVITTKLEANLLFFTGPYKNLEAPVIVRRYLLHSAYASAHIRNHGTSISHSAHSFIHRTTTHSNILPVIFIILE